MTEFDPELTVRSEGASGLHVETPESGLEEAVAKARPTLRGHVRIARPDHWIKNVMLLPGVVIGLALVPSGWTAPDHLLLNLLLGFVSVCLVASSNYVINEVMDASFDRHHPTKWARPVVSGQVNVKLAYAQWLGLMAAGLGLGLVVSVPFALAMLALWLSGSAYNIPPLRTKDLPYLDVVTEAVTNPLRLIGGWFLVEPGIFPPSSLLISYWLFGCFFMALKRIAEYRFIAAHGRAVAYRRSFASYTSGKLLILTMVLGSLAMLFFGAFLVRYRLELLLSLPLVLVVMGLYMHLAFQEDSPVQHPEGLYRELPLTAVVVICAVVMGVLLFVDVPVLHRLFGPAPHL